MLVVDSSAIVHRLVARPLDPRLVTRIGEDGDLHAPHLIDVEVLHVLRRHVRVGGLSEDRAADARFDFADLAIQRHGHEHLRDRIWALRHNLTAYDAAFVALAGVLDVPLVTCDARLAATSGHAAEIELFAPR